MAHFLRCLLFGLLAVSARGYDVWQTYEPSGHGDGYAGVIDGCLWQERMALLSAGAQPRLLWTRFWDGAPSVYDYTSGSDSEQLPAIQPASVAIGAGRIVIVGREGRIISRPIASRPVADYDLRPWDYQASGTFADLKRVRFLNGRFVAIGKGFADWQNPLGNRNDIVTSLDGVTWTRHRFTAADVGGKIETMLDITFRAGVTPETGTWLVGIDREGSCLRFSEDFTTATRVTVAGLGTGQQVCFGSGAYVIASDSGLYRSVDGVVFSPLDVGPAYKVAYDGERFVAFRWQYPGTVIHSVDGLGWTPASTVPFSDYQITWLTGSLGLWVASDSQGLLFSKPSTVPQITTQPTPYTRLEQGGSLALSVEVADAASKRFAWYRVGETGLYGERLSDNGNISGAETASLTLSTMLQDDAGDYRVVVYDAASSVISDIAKVAVSVQGQGAVLTMNDVVPAPSSSPVVTSPNGVFRVEGRWRYEQHGEQVTSVLLESSEDAEIGSVADDGTCAGKKTLPGVHERAAVWGRAGTFRLVEDILVNDYALALGTRHFTAATISGDGLTLRGIGHNYEHNIFHFQWSLALASPLTEAAPTPRLALAPSDTQQHVLNDELQDYIGSFSMPVMGYDDVSRSLTFTITNEGRKDLNVSSIRLVGAQAAFFSLNAPALPLILAPAQSQTVQVTYGTARPAAGEHQALLRITSDDPVKPVHLVQVKGERDHDYAPDLPFAISVMDGTRRLNTKAGVDFGVVNAGSNLTRTLSIQNVSQHYAEPFPYENVEFSIFGAQAASFTLTSTASTKLAPNQKVSRVVRFQPATAGFHFAWLKIEFDVGEQWIPLTGEVQASGAPVIVGLLPSQIMDASMITDYDTLSTGRTFSVQVVSGSMPMKYQWWKNGARIAGATGTSLRFKAIKPADAGSYSFSATNPQGQTTHTPVSHIAVFSLDYPGRIAEGRPFEWNIQHGKPPGCTLGFLWSNFGGIPWPATYSGMTTSRLRTSKAVFPLPASHIAFDLTFTMPGGQILKRNVLFEQAHYISPARWPGKIRLPIAAVGCAVTADLPRFDPWIQPYDAGLFHVTYSAIGLPPGITLNTKTGRLTGTPTAARVVKGIVEPYEVKLTAKCTFPAASETQTVQWMIRPLPAEMTGSFEGVAFDSMVVLDILPTGRFSGSMSVFGKKSPFGGSLSVALGTEGELVVSPVTLTKPRTLTLTYMSFGSQQSSFWSISFDGAQEDGNRGKLFRCPISSRQPYPGPRGPFHVGLLNVYPGYHGSGFATLQISAAGTGAWAGTLTDGETFTASQRVVSMSIYDSDDNSWSAVFGMALHSSQATKQVVASALELMPDGRIEGADGTFATFKTRSSNYGTLRLLGARYVAPGTGQMWPGFVNAAANASLSLTILEEYPWDGVFTFALAPSGSVKLPAFGATDPKVTLSVAPSTGRVSGTVTMSIPDPDSPSGQTRRLTRSGPFAGLFIPHPEINKVIGHVNLPLYPTPEVPASKTVIRSGPLELKPAAAP